MEQWVAKHGEPELWVLGDALGVDRMAYQVCKWHGWKEKVVFVNERLPVPQRFHDRNQRMVDLCEVGDVCFAFPRTDSRGTFDCLNRAKRRGLTVHVANAWPAVGRAGIVRGEAR
jgi:hypothetical protein